LNATVEKKASAIVPTYATAEDAVTVSTVSEAERDSDEADEDNSIMITYTAAEAPNNCGTSVNIAVNTDDERYIVLTYSWITPVSVRI